MTDGVIETSTAAAPVGPYPHARRFGDLLFLSGIGPRRPGATTEIPGLVRQADGVPQEYDFEAQCRATFDNVDAVLRAAGARLADVVDITCFLVNMADFPLLNRIWSEVFADSARRPARTTVEVRRLPTPIAIELKVIAAMPTAAPNSGGSNQP